MKLVMVLTTQRDGEIITIFSTRSPLVPDDPEVMSISHGVPTNATAVATNHGHMLFAS
jgi:hypothetical protein